MKSLLRTHCFLLSFLFSFALTAQQTFSCLGDNGVYFITVTNPNATDGDDGNLDGNCEYNLTTNIFSTISPITFTYVGANSAVPNAVVQAFFPVQAMVITAPCGNLDLSFDLTDTNGDDVCMIRNVVMPVELVNFQAKAVNQGVQLSWITASEFNNLGFDVERSENGKNWKPITFIEGNLTTFEAQQYEFVDEHPISGISYYRLKQMDTDGQYEYSEMISVEYSSVQNDFKLYPNPANDQMTIHLSQEQYEPIEITLFDATGKLVYNSKTMDEILNIHFLPNGLYTAIINASGKIYRARFTKK